MGASTALLMARRGADVTLFEAAPAPMTGASRWNEGKIHLGHLYAADPSLATARRVLAGGLAFPRLLRMLIDTPLDDAVTPADDVYAVHRDSIVAADAAAAYLDAVTALARQHPEARAYFTDLRHAAVRRLSPVELARDHDPSRVVAAFAVPERSIDTRRVADRIVGALHAQSGLALRLGTRVDAVGRDTDAGRLHVSTSAGREGPFDLVVNALWQGRLAIDATLGLAVPPERSHRYRLSVFARADGPVELPSTVVATGPFGDVKHYGGGRLYLSWYPAGLRAQGDGIAPPPLPALDADARERIADATLAGLQAAVPAVARLRGRLVERRVEGGWVYATGSGSLGDHAASLHRRDRLGLVRSGGYVSIDTGKYSVAPWLARELVREVFGD